MAVMQRKASSIPQSRRARSTVVLVAGCLTALVVGCAGAAGGAIEIDQLPEESRDVSGEYIIDVGDVLNVQVFDQPTMSGKMRVRSDGRISLPLINEIQAAGKTPVALTTEVEASLKKLILVPKVTITVEESSPLSISILGEVGKPGPQLLPRGSGLAQALAGAGGLTNFAHKDRIYVVRTEPKPLRIHFTYDALTRAVGRAATFKLRSGDVIVVE
jgi:polysaccharide biosynthesis/export protein